MNNIKGSGNGRLIDSSIKALGGKADMVPEKGKWILYIEIFGLAVWQARRKAD